MKNQNHQDLIQKLLNCALTCENCATSCLQEEDVAMMAKCIRLDIDGSDICFQAARLLQRESQIALQFLLLCEEVCRMCADECSKHDAEHCRRCAEACRVCAEACHENHRPIEQD
ncbi:four-helix bundle copper-binding protein [Pedobacter sp. P351]|uniref:four-helix bundle copper-binding protein n=1 Tax=Pedobacter superstes TaxID=3133441 RepID=UPI0030A986F2